MLSSCPICGSTTPATCAIISDWIDDERMAFLTSHVPPDDANAREQMVTFWSKAVAHAFEWASTLSLDPAHLAKTSLAWGGAIAPGMEIAVAHMVSAKILVRRPQIEDEAGLAKILVVTPVVYLMGLMGLGGGTGQIPGGQHVHRDVLDDLGAAVLSFCQQLPEDERTVYLKMDALESMSKAVPQTSPVSFRDICAATAKASPPDTCAARVLPKMSFDDLHLLAHDLTRRKRAVVDDRVLKVFARDARVKCFGNDKFSSASASVLEADKDLLRLRCTVYSLQRYSTDLGRRIKQCKSDALRESRQGEKRAAVVAMRTMKHYQAARDSRLASLLTLETALDKVKQLRLDKQVLQAHEAATSALKTIRQAEGLSVERVADTLDAFAEEMEEQEAISDALLPGVGSLQDHDEISLLESELDDLLREDNTPLTATQAVDGGGGDGDGATTGPKPTSSLLRSPNNPRGNDSSSNPAVDASAGEAKFAVNA